MPRWVKPVVVVLVIAIGATGLWWQMSADQSTLQLAGVRYHISIMRTDAELQKGLSGTDSLPPGEAMLLVFPEGTPSRIWMKDMNYPIDIVWLNDDRTVVHMEENVAPSTYDEANPSESTIFRSDVPARYVIELPSGTIEKTHIKKGDPAGLPAGP